MTDSNCEKSRRNLSESTSSGEPDDPGSQRTPDADEETGRRYPP